MSAAAKARIAAAQKKRWAKFRQQKAAAAGRGKGTAKTAVKARRKPVSAEVRQKRLEALAKARAARAAKRSSMVKTAGS